MNYFQNDILPNLYVDYSKHNGCRKAMPDILELLSHSLGTIYKAMEGVPKGIPSFF